MSRGESRERQAHKPPLTIEQILAWADAYHERTGKWPTINSGEIPGANGDTWAIIYQALYHGHRGLPGGSSLSRLLAEHRGVRNRMDLPPLTKEQILAWAEAHYRRKKRWPTQYSGAIAEAPGETWKKIDRALYRGERGLPGGETLAQFLVRRRGVKNVRLAPPLRIAQILNWADAHYRRYRKWPQINSGRIVGTFGETWRNINADLRRGCRGLPGGSSLRKLLAEHRGVRARSNPPPLTIERILAWADAHYGRTGEWPKESSGPIGGTDGETWAAVSWALRKGSRGLPGGSSLARLLEEKRGRKHPFHRPRLTIRQILKWADAHFRHTGEWPTQRSGAVVEQPDENWANIDAALRLGCRGLRRRSSLSRLLDKHRGRPSPAARPRLTVGQILAWADAHHERTGQWPTRESGELPEAPGETWMRIDNALQKGHRGLPGGTTLARLLAERRGCRSKAHLPALTVEQILKWAEDHHARTGQWPKHRSGPIPGVPGETWSNIDYALVYGKRGLPEGPSLARLLAEHMGIRNPAFRPPLDEEQLVRWALAHYQRTGKWPTRSSGEVREAPGETWRAIDLALSQGGRGLPGGSSLAKLLEERCGKPPRRTAAWPSQNPRPMAGAGDATWAAVNSALVQGHRGLSGGNSLAGLLDRYRGKQQKRA